MYFSFKNKKITGAALILPEVERSFLDDMKLFNADEKRSLRLAKVMGYDKHRIAPKNVAASDMAEFGFKSLFEDGSLKKDDMDALIYITASPDHFLPPTSRILHGKLGLRQDAYCIDITQGCCAFEEGLIQAFLLLDQPTIKKVAVVTTDVLSHKVSVKDRNSYPLIGDAASITIVEKSELENNIEAVILNDGTRSDALKIPAGGFRMPCSPETAVLHADEEGNERSLDNLVMDGTAVFNFVMQDVPPMLFDLFKRANVSKDDIDWFLFHQPNRFMLQKLAEKLEVPYEKMPSNVVEKYGNSSGTTVPAVTVLTFEGKEMSERQKVCFSGFGVGLTWAAIVMELGKLEFCKTIVM
ncbi:MAG: ketoacyl-ACP synthase III [Treponema sp.]|nr:ketoacyl-ACP synthase III [Treponema sp.]